MAVFTDPEGAAFFAWEAKDTKERGWSTIRARCSQGDAADMQRVPSRGE